MGANTKIEWATHSFNPWIGCRKISPGCQNCYAETLNKRMKWTEWGAGKLRTRTAPSNWAKPVQWNAKAAEAGVRPRVFCASLADWLDDEVPGQWRDDLIALVRETPQLDWLLLTKRIERAVGIELPANVWLGVSAENQEMWDRRVPVLLSIPATVRFVSAEPLLGAIDMNGLYPEWLIVGGESGPRSRPMDESWVGDLQRQCRNRTAFFFKQWGGVRKSETGRELGGRTWSALPV